MNSLNVFVLVVGLSAVLINNAAARLHSEGIVGGDNAVEGDYTYQISLQVVDRNMCGGSIIGKRHVITAAHCVTTSKGNFNGIPIKVVAGISDLKSKSENRVTIDVEKIYIPTEYGPAKRLTRSTADVAILRLKEDLPLDINPNLSKLELPEERTFAGERAVISGFGWNWVNLEVDKDFGFVTETGGGSYNKLRFAKVDVLNNEQCNKHFRSLVTEKHICAAVVQRNAIKHEGICSGDSGGPLVFNGKTLIGVVSTSPVGCVEHANPAVYTRVSFFLDFIDKAVNDKDDDPEVRSISFPA